MIINTNTYIQNKTFKQSFGNGRIKLYADFDRTFLPSTQKGIQNLGNASQVPALISYFDNFARFLSRAGDTVRFSITTGRNLGEFKILASIIRAKGLKMPMPDSLITKNGGDEFLREGGIDEFSRTGKFPFLRPNPAKRDRIKRQTNWDGAIVRAKIEEILGYGYDFDIRRPVSTNSPNDYGDKSLFHTFRDDFNPQNPQFTPMSPWVVSIRQDGDLGISLGFPKNMRYAQDRIQAEHDIIGQIEQFFNEKGISRSIQKHDKDGDCGGHPTLTFTPTDKGKFYDSQQAVEEAIKENDMVIVAGDSSNDVQMLNPICYLDQNLFPEIRDFMYSPKDIVKLMDSNPRLAEAYRKLPLISIVVRNSDKSNECLEEFLEHYGKGKYKKIIGVQEGRLLEGIQEAVHLYKAQNAQFNLENKNLF